MKKAYIGYDLGDGETITDFVVLDGGQVRHSSKTVFIGMTMPDNNTPGQAIPTAFGYDEEGKLVFTSSILQDPECVKNIRANFKRRPMDLMGKVSVQRGNEIITMLSKGEGEDVPEIDTPEMRRFAESVISFTNAIFEEPRYAEAVRGASVDCGEIVVCVGHPTRWNELDVAIYKYIISKSVLGSGAYVGKKCSLLMAAESRAAFLYVKDTADASLPKDTCALLIDVGSSTIDLTAMTSDSRNHQYNSGSNYLGARSVDFMIRDWYLGRLRKSEEDWMSFQTLIAMNPTVDQALTLSCRKAKEDVFSLAAKKSRILFADFAPVKIDQATVEELARTVPIGPILKQYIGLPEAQLQAMGDKSWVQYFRDFLHDQRAQMEAKSIKLGRIILTGSASKMPFVREVVGEVFPELSGEGVLSDMNPSRSISMGLALVGPSNDKSGSFQQDLEKILTEEVPRIIDSDLPTLIDSLSKVISTCVRGIVLKRVAQWKSGSIATLNDMTDAIARDCSEKNMNELLKDNKEYKEAMRHWVVDVVSQDIAKRLQSLCDKYGVRNITLDELNVLKVSSISVGGLSFNPAEGMMNVVSGVVSLLAGIITAIILPTVLGIIVGIISLISFNFAIDLLLLLAAIPGAGWTLIIAIAGAAAWAAVRHGMSGAKEKVARMIQGANLPGWARKLLKNEKIAEKLNSADIDGQVRRSLDTPECREKIVTSVKDNLNRQIVKRMEDIKYVIESK